MSTQREGTNDDSIAAQMGEEEPYGSVAEGVFESRQRLVEGQLRTPTAERLMAGAANVMLQPAHHSSISEGVASAGNPMGLLGALEAHGSAERMDRMGEFNPVAGDRVGSGEAQFGAMNQGRGVTPFNEGMGGNSLVGGGEQSTDERIERLRHYRRVSRERFGETNAMTQSVMHESNLFDGDADDNEGTNTPARMAGFDDEMKASEQNGSLETRSYRRKSRLAGDMAERNEGNGVNHEHYNEENERPMWMGYCDGSVRQVPSEFAMVTGLSDGENDIVMDMERKIVSPVEPTDSNLGCIDINDAIDDDKMIGSGSFKNRPSDADIMAWENQIKRNAQQNSMLIGNRVSLDDLIEEYARGSNEQWKANVADLTRAYGSMRRSRGDGNCFFRAFIFSYLEHVIETDDMAEKNRMVSHLARIKDGLLRVGYDDLVLEGPMELLSDILGAVLTVEALEKQLRTEDISNYIVFLLRMISSGEVREKATFFAPFIMGLVDMGVDEFCAKCIDPMGEESDHVVLVALTNALRVPMRVVYVDGAANERDGRLDVKDFVPDGCRGDRIAVHLLYRPGHYDIIYPV